jgi:hypothetical protein
MRACRHSLSLCIVDRSNGNGIWARSPVVALHSQSHRAAASRIAPLHRYDPDPPNSPRPPGRPVNRLSATSVHYVYPAARGVSLYPARVRAGITHARSGAPRAPLLGRPNRVGTGSFGCLSFFLLILFNKILRFENQVKFRPKFLFARIKKCSNS